ncbi:MAG: GreA/GreB family elongation factor [Myxococcales bacterium]|nr:GreA/GreB family elongation factor [Myxococcales bacterium]
MADANEYISYQGYQRLSDERDRLARVERPAVVLNVSAAAAEGDLSENAEYIYGKRRLREIDKRLEFLTGRLDKLTPVKEATSNDRVVFLSYVHVEDAKGNEHVFRLVGADESDTKDDSRWISYLSPVGRALLGKQVDDDVRIRTPGGLKQFTILEISTDPIAM